MKKRRVSIRSISLLLLLVAALAAVIIFVVMPSREAWAHSRTLSDALTGARSVTLIEFERDRERRRESVFTRVSATPQQIAALRSATSAWLAPSDPLLQAKCFEPHHRVEIVRADGSTLRMDVCFLCGNFRMGDPGDIMMMPASWRDRLSQFFTSAGMPPRKDYSALVKNLPD